MIDYDQNRADTHGLLCSSVSGNSFTFYIEHFTLDIFKPQNVKLSM